MYMCICIDMINLFSSSDSEDMEYDSEVLGTCMYSVF